MVNWKKLLMCIASVVLVWLAAGPRPAFNRISAGNDDPRIGHVKMLAEAPPSPPVLPSLPASTSPCPHPDFVGKHMCYDCVTIGDSLRFSQPRRPEKGKRGRVVVNTIVHGVRGPNGGDKDLDFELSPSKVCKNVQPTRVDVCNLLEPQTCFTRGFKCITSHMPENGHYEYDWIVCEKKYDWEFYYPSPNKTDLA